MELFVTEKRYQKAIQKPMELAIERNKKYGNSIRLMSDKSIIELVMMKLDRTKELPPTADKTDDELVDCINYLVYVRMRRQNPEVPQ